MKQKSETTLRRDEFKRHKKEIDELFQRKLKALYELYPEFATTSAESTSVPESKGGYGVLSKLVKQAIDKHHEVFTLQDMHKWVSELDPVFGAGLRRQSIYNAISRLIRKQKLEKLSDGSGYKKK